jgi:hypothetical protein
MRMGAAMKIDYYKVLDECVETGINLGMVRVYKHADNPSEDQVKDAIHRAVMDEICEYFKFEVCE